MFSQQIEKWLRDDGRTEKQLHVMSVLHQSNPLSFTDLQHQTGMQKSTLKKVLDALIKSQMISTIDCNGQRVYVPPPDGLLGWARRKTKDAQEKERQIAAFMQNFDGPRTLPMPMVWTYKGRDGVKESYERMLRDCKPESEIYAVYSVEQDVGKDLQEFFTHTYVPARVQKNISMRNIALDSPKARAYKDRDAAELRETKFAPKDKLPALNAEINVYGDYVHTMSFDGRGAFALIVEEPNQAALKRAMIQMLWEFL